MWLQQLGFPLTKADLATASAEYVVVQQLKPNLSSWYELGLNATEPGKEMDSLQTTTANMPSSAQHSNVRIVVLKAKTLSQLGWQSWMPPPLGLREQQLSPVAPVGTKPGSLCGELKHQRSLGKVAFL